MQQPDQNATENARVCLVGAGPGDPGLITVRGAELLAAADVVVYDALVNPRLLTRCPHAEKIYVGKRSGAHSFSQEQINAVLVEHGKRGRRVVRLKGGDPFVFGRGGEECAALAAAGLRFEVVPGVTAAMAAPAYAGIPVTHRDFNSSFTFITGHEKEEEYRDPAARQRGAAAGSSDVDWTAIARLPCVAFYMGVKSLPRICAKLLENGMRPDMPAATIQWGTTSRQRTVVGTLSDLAARVAEAGIAPPAMTIIGQVVSLRQTMNWFEQRPLFGRTIVVTRTREQASELTEKLTELGANVIEAPTIELTPASDQAAVDDALRSIASCRPALPPGGGWAADRTAGGADLTKNIRAPDPLPGGERTGGASGFDWVVFTSQNGVRHTKQRLFELGLDARSLGGAKIAAIGEATAAVIREELGLRVDLCPSRFVAEALAEDLEQRGEVRGKRFLLLRADIARPVLRERLQHGGAAEVRDVAVYQTKPVAGLPEELTTALDAGEVAWVTFTSSSTATNFTSLLGSDFRQRLAGVKHASIGPVTSATLKELGLLVTVQAERFDIDGLVTALLAMK